MEALKTHSVIVAGASGLIGSELTKMLSEANNVSTIHLLLRKPHHAISTKIHQHLNPDLVPTDWSESDPLPEYGFICLGTTLKQAGSKQALAKVDFDLVCQVAKTMQTLGVKRLAVVSSIGASATSLSHYLKCKGKMEQALQSMGFERLVIVRPGPLTGERNQTRLNETITEALLKPLSPFMIGSMANYKPIEGKDVARAMLYALFQIDEQYLSATRILHSKEMWALIHQY
ncbi:NAD(P)H-binding protein [Vibrio sp. SCSIO 43136]|uniref:NAD(P)H-binding protein n=1 Tax=Vibrio sp. SCSIO 43136 TaxID=2819101 RepID=UPI002075D729|nr:NAD(P)H-binding protein [Vibrio sp. SCSIO 43136]USD63989.1 NAD(P)H-binding protein [Vibrio sp. SCSIO 43136]